MVPLLDEIRQGKKGRVVLLDFWAIWCAPCVAGLPGLDGTRASGDCAWRYDEDAARPRVRAGLRRLRVPVPPCSDDELAAGKFDSQICSQGSGCLESRSVVDPHLTSLLLSMDDEPTERTPRT